MKEKGFNEKLLTFYITDETKKEGYFQLMAFTDDKIDNNHSDHCYLAPTLQMAMKWLREIHHVHIRLINSTDESYRYEIYPRKGKYVSYCFSDKSYYETYEQACEAAIKWCLENLI